MSRRAIRLFAEAVERDDDDIELDVAALLVGAWDCDDLDVARHQRTLDDIAARAKGAIAAASDVPAVAARPWAAARAIAETLFTDLGYRGNTADYHDPRNSFLGEVLGRRVGIPITLSVLYIEVARRLGVRASGVGFPGHFLVRVDEGGPLPLMLDPFHGGAELDRGDLEALLARFAGPDARLDRASLEPSPKRKILIRMLNNLAAIYGRAPDLFRSLEVLERLAILDGENPRIAAELEQLRHRVGALN